MNQQIDKMQLERLQVNIKNQVTSEYLTDTKL